MKKFGAFFFVTVMALSGLAAKASAQDVGSMSCIDVRTLLDNRNSSPSDMRPIFNFVQSRFLADDDTWIAQGHGPVAGNWNVSGMQNNIAMVTVTCASNRDESLADRTDDVFGMLAQFEVTMGATQ